MRRGRPPRNEVIDRIYDAGELELPDGQRVRADTHGMPPAEGEALYELVRRERPSATVETGMAFGLSTLFICQALADLGAGGTHTAIDPHQADFADLGLAHVREAGLEQQLSFVREPAELALPRMLSEGAGFELGFIDGHHLFEHAFVDLFFVDRLLPVGGLLILDDTWMPSVSKVARFAVSNLGYEDESPPEGGPGRGAAARRRGRRLRRGLRAAWDSRGFAFAGPDREVPGVELPKPRVHRMAVLRKRRSPAREWSHFVPF